MQWRERRRSENVEDRRGFGVRRPMVAGGGGLLLLVVLVFALCGKDPSELLRVLEETGQVPPSADIDAGDVPGSFPQAPGEPRQPRPDDELAEFASVVLADTEDTWSRIFRAGGQAYHPPRLVLFSDAVESACGFSSAAVGPFYCPGDQQVYIDLAFFADLRDRFGAPGDFAQAYVVAHEIGHHVQNLLGLSDRVRELQSRARPAGGQRAWRAHGAAGRLPGRRLGSSCRHGPDVSRAGGHRGRPSRSRGDRRRSAPAHGDGPREP